MIKSFPLQEIDKAIRINCAIDRNAPKALTLVKFKGQNNKGIGRCLFIYFAKKAGFSREEICDYLAINKQEYESKLAMLDELYIRGRELFETKVSDLNYQESRDSDLFFYRKLVLISNYLRYRYNFHL